MNKTKKILLGGAGGVGRTTLLRRYVENRWYPSPLTIGVQFFSKNIEIGDVSEKLVFFDFAGQKRWRFFQEELFSGADGAILTFDYQRFISFSELKEWIILIRKHNPNIPILLVGTKADSENRAVLKHDIIEFMKYYDLFGFVEVSSLTGENVIIMFENLVRKIIGLEVLNVPEIPFRPTERTLNNVKTRNNSNYTIKTYMVNEYITLQLDWNTTNIYVSGLHFSQCKYLLMNISTEKIDDYDEINSIDEAEEQLIHTLESRSVLEYEITPEAEFWGHCSNLQAWVEHNYNTRLLHRNLAFPLLKKLTEAGDPLAKKVFKDEIALRLEENFPSVTRYLVEEGYLDYFNPEELDMLFNKNSELSSFKKKIYYKRIKVQK